MSTTAAFVMREVEEERVQLRRVPVVNVSKRKSAACRSDLVQATISHAVSVRSTRGEQYEENDNPAFHGTRSQAPNSMFTNPWF